MTCVDPVSAALRLQSTATTAPPQHHLLNPPLLPILHLHTSKQLHNKLSHPQILHAPSLLSLFYRSNLWQHKFLHCIWWREEEQEEEKRKRNQGRRGKKRRKGRRKEARRRGPARFRPLPVRKQLSARSGPKLAGPACRACSAACSSRRVARRQATFGSAGTES